MRMQTHGAALVASLVAMTPLTAAAQSICGDREPIVKRLAEAYGERRRVEAVTVAGTLMEIFVSRSGSWTLLATLPSGPTCLISAGDGWQHLETRRDGA